MYILVAKRKECFKKESMSTVPTSDASSGKVRTKNQSLDLAAKKSSVIVTREVPKQGEEEVRLG